ncbi:hypothetical protein ACFV1L_18430 [Kitasatospora sp. NPDC059646]|uniref:hypothetical protein n=1 Tax=Kitasatospora sp. NPDC059646 TaxID=3346893 RepID=UPI0036A99357
MPQHKMVVVDGIRYRVEDAPARPEPVQEPSPGPGQQRPAAPSSDDTPFDPDAHTVEDVLAHLLAADGDERARVLAAEAEGKARKGVLEANLTPPGTSGGAAS